MSATTPRFRLTIVHPCVGRRAGMTRYIRTWLMQPIPAAMIAALCPPDVDVRFYDDRLEAIAYDEPTDLVAISVETYTARRCYQIASEFRRRRVPVVMGGFHATLCPEEVAQYCESLVVGPAEGVFGQLLDDYRHGTPARRYQSPAPPPLTVSPNRAIFAGKRYLPIGLIEFARGCRFKCDFCAVTAFHHAASQTRDVERVTREIQQARRRGQMVFFIDDNFSSDLPAAKELMRTLIPLRLRWVSQSAINVAFDDEALDLMRRSGCQGVLVGFETLNAANLMAMNKGFNLMRGGAAEALANFRRHNLRVYGTFIFGYQQDTAQTFAETLRFARDQGLFIAAFNHLTPFPGTPLYERLQREGRLLYESWWLDERYRYNMVPFQPWGISPEELARCCLQARQSFYGWPSVMERALKPINRSSLYMLGNFLAINALHHWDVDSRSGLPLGDETWPGPLLKAQ